MSVKPLPDHRLCTPVYCAVNLTMVDPELEGTLYTLPSPIRLQVLPLSWAFEGVKKMQKSLALNQAWNPILSELTNQLFLKKSKEKRKKEKGKKNTLTVPVTVPAS